LGGKDSNAKTPYKPTTPSLRNKKSRRKRAATLVFASISGARVENGRFNLQRSSIFFQKGLATGGNRKRRRGVYYHQGRSNRKFLFPKEMTRSRCPEELYREKGFRRGKFKNILRPSP